MKKTLIVAAVVAGFSGVAAKAQTVVSDTDGNGVYSVEELTAAYPEMNAALFKELDADGNGSVDADELQAARENGVIAQ